jgi:alkanesulfonate monooxygenase SsuD/methylene tetrahydromethanopterin reductase-like flavin-dependent oxidoreductase (luciferase family)
LLIRAQSLEGARRVAEGYRAAFRANESLAAPRVAVVCPVLCAPSETAARALWQALFAARDDAEMLRLNAGAMPEATTPPETFVVGDPARCCDVLARIADRIGATELLVYCVADSLDGVAHAYTRLAAQLGLGAQSPVR